MCVVFFSLGSVSDHHAVVMNFLAHTLNIKREREKKPKMTMTTQMRDRAASKCCEFFNSYRVYITFDCDDATFTLWTRLFEMHMRYASQHKTYIHSRVKSWSHKCIFGGYKKKERDAMAPES